MTNPFPLIDIGGTPKERGRQYGRQAGERIEANMLLYKDTFVRQGFDWPQVRKIAGDYLPRIERYDHELLDEIRGIADGVEHPVEDIVALNARTEILYDQKISSKDVPEPNDGCTGAIVLPKATADGHLLHGQNWDWYDACKDVAVVLRIDCGNGLMVLTFAEAGIVARSGMNNQGIALTGNFLETESQASENSVPIPLVRRRVLQSRNLADAIQEAIQAPRSFSANMMISHRDGAAVDLETTPEDVFWEKPNCGILVHANHFRSPGAVGNVKDLGLIITPDSLYRDTRVDDALTARHGDIRIDDMKKAFADDFGLPYAVCRPPSPNSRGILSSTVVTIIMDTTEGRMLAAPTPYEGGSYTEYRFD